MDTAQETIYCIALTRLCYCSLVDILYLYKQMGSATAIAEHRNDICSVLPEASPRLIQSLSNFPEAVRRAEAELQYNQQHDITTLTYNDPHYPRRLRECDDAPIVLFYRGNADLNQEHIVSIVGTRHCTSYGLDITSRFVRELKQLCPQVLVVSGLAYGIDIQAHRESLANGYETVGVLAHGIDYLYPRAHCATAEKMVSQGGLITEFLTNTNAEKMNFVRRNRIVAGLADACILVESAAKGGGLITAGIAMDYHRDVFAFPGNVSQQSSDGCNHLIRDNKAGLITNAVDFTNAMGWTNNISHKSISPKTEEKYKNLTDAERRIVQLLQKSNDMQVNVLATRLSMPIATVLSSLFTLEMKNVVRTMAGGVYHLIV